MQIAIISDIHGNLDAFEAILSDIDKSRLDVVINLGDCLSGPLQAAQTADLLMKRNFLTVRGNHDRALIERTVDRMGISDRLAAEQLSEAIFPGCGVFPPLSAVKACCVATELQQATQPICSNPYNLAKLDCRHVQRSLRI
jgi:predicted phosphodiesterase